MNNGFRMFGQFVHYNHARTIADLLLKALNERKRELVKTWRFGDFDYVSMKLISEIDFMLKEINSGNPSRITEEMLTKEDLKNVEEECLKIIDANQLSNNYSFLEEICGLRDAVKAKL